MAVLLSLFAAICYGLSDFSAGVATRRTDPLFVCVVVEAASVLLSVAILPFTFAGPPSAGAVIWGLASGVGSAGGTFALYYGFGRGNLSVVGPLSAVAATALPALAGLAWGEHLTALAIAGVLAAFPAVWLVSLAPRRPGGRAVAPPPAGGGPQGDRPRRRARRALERGAPFGLAAGAGFALMFVALDRAGGHYGLFPVVVSQVMGLGMFSIAQLRVGHPRVWRWRTLTVPVVAGVSGGAATIFYFAATHVGLLVVVVVLTTLYPAVTVVLSRLFLRERLSIFRGLGLLLAGASTTMIIVGTY
jgi:drug/metabolite transporter (DMT)-like permease